MKAKLALALVALAVGLIASPLGANPRVSVVSDWAISDNMTALGYSARVVPLDNNSPDMRDGVFNSDLAFQDDMVVQGTYGGFRLIDVTYPSRPKEIVNWEECDAGTNTIGNQGDVIVWGDLVIRSWNSGTPAPVYPAGHPMAGQTIPTTDPARSRHRARSVATGRCSASPPTRPSRRAVSVSAARKACTSSTSRTRRRPTPSGSSPRRAAPTRRRSCRISPTTGCSSTRTRRAATCSAIRRATRRRSRAPATTSSDPAGQPGSGVLCPLRGGRRSVHAARHGPPPLP